MTAYTEPRRLPAEYVKAGDAVRIHTDASGGLWVNVVNVTECDERCPDRHSVVVEYPATTIHYGALDFLTVRIPCEPDPATTPAGPAPGERVYITTARTGIPMHRLQPDNPAATACGRSTRTGLTLRAVDADDRWDSQPCRRCWPVTT